MLWGLLVSLGLSLVHTGCQTIPTRTYEVRQRAFTYEPSSLVRDYQEEYAYIQQRRLTVMNGEGTGPFDERPLANRVPAHLTGLAFSGGGIRSATFHLGMLQALHDMKRLPRIDYLSTVSGGSYIAGWMLAHLGKPLDDAYGNLVQTPDQGTLLDPQQDFVTHLRHHAGFIKEGGFWEGPKLLWGYLWRLTPYYIWDLALHIKTPPDIGNELHLFTPYQHRIEATYLRGKHDTPLVRLNRKTAGMRLISSSMASRSIEAGLAPIPMKSTAPTATITTLNSPGTIPVQTGWATYKARDSGCRWWKPRQMMASRPGSIRAKSWWKI